MRRLARRGDMIPPMLAIAALVFSVAPPVPQDWPHFRGPNHNGHTRSQATWAAKGKPQAAWTTNVGRGYSSPSISGDHLVTLGFDEKKGIDRISCLHRETGKAKWAFEFAATDKPQYHGGGTLSTPTIHEGQVYCLNRDGMFHVLDLKAGTVQWSRNYGKELGVPRTFHGFSSAPMVEEDRIYLQFGGLVFAANKSDGDVLWRSKDHGDASHANLLPLQLGGQPAVATIAGTTFFAFRKSDGKVLHEHAWPLSGGAMHCSMPLAIGADRVFLSTAYNKGCALLQLSSDKEPAVVWENRRMRNKVTACVEHEGHLYGFDESMLRCLDMNGASKWRVRGLGLGSLSIVDNRLIVVNADGELIVAKASPDSFEELSREKVLEGGVYWSAPVFVDGLIYVRNSLGDLTCRNHRQQGASADSADATPPAPTAASLFAEHNELVGGRALYTNSDKVLQLRGKWSVPLRGVKDDDMTWTLAADRWDLRLDDAFFYTFDGNQAWTVEPQGPRIIQGDELFEHRHLFALPELFAPSGHASSQTSDKPVRFAETSCWKVTSTIAQPQQRTRTVQHFFAVDGGRLMGRQGKDESTVVFHGTQRLNGLTLPQRTTRYRAEDGQEHVMVIEQAEWIDAPAELFDQPVSVLRLRRTPAERARDNAALKKRFDEALARYQAKDTDTPLGEDIVTLRVHDGDIWFADPYDEYRLAIELEKDGVINVEGPPIQIALIKNDKGQTTALKMIMGPRSILLGRLKD